MKNLTKQAIQLSLLRRLEEEPLSHVTVRALCADFGINHNTFYYYYPDIYSVIQEYFEENMDEVRREYDRTESWEKAFERAIAPALQYRKAVLHIFHSVQKENLENYLYRSATDIMEAFVGTISPETAALPDDRTLIAHFFAGDRPAGSSCTDVSDPFFHAALETGHRPDSLRSDGRKQRDG